MCNGCRTVLVLCSESDHYRGYKSWVVGELVKKPEGFRSDGTKDYIKTLRGFQSIWDWRLRHRETIEDAMYRLDSVREEDLRKGEDHEAGEVQRPFDCTEPFQEEYPDLDFYERLEREGQQFW